MNQKLIIAGVLVFIQYLHINAQDKTIIDKTEYIANYQYTYQTDSTNIDKIKSDYMTLYIGDKYSKFEHQGRYYRDSLIRSCNSNSDADFSRIMGKMKSIKSGGHFTSYKVIKKKFNDTIVLYEGPVTPKTYIKTEEALSFKWQLVNNDEKVVCDYRCNKAITTFRGRKYTAWYTMEIPISDGPYKFKGLPGLIIQIQDSKKQHIFTLESIIKINYKKPIYFENEKYHKVSDKQYYAAKKNQLLELADMISNPEIVSGSFNRAEIEAKTLSNNNYIEKTR